MVGPEHELGVGVPSRAVGESPRRPSGRPRAPARGSHPRPGGPARRTHVARRQARAGQPGKVGSAARPAEVAAAGPMQDSENVAAPEAAERRAEPGQQEPAAEPPPEDEPPRPAGSGAQEAGGENAEAGAVPGPDEAAEPAADGPERVGAAPVPSPPPPEEPPAPAAREAPADQPRDVVAEARSEGAGGEDGGADEPSFSDPEDFVDDVSEEGEAARPPPVSRAGEGFHEFLGRLVFIFYPKTEGCGVATNWGLVITLGGGRGRRSVRGAVAARVGRSRTLHVCTVLVGESLCAGLGVPSDQPPVRPATASVRTLRDG